MSAQKVCPQCGTEYPLDQRFCPLDGATLKSQGGGADLVGSVVADRYYVLRKLGEGGMGQVYLAEHVRMGRKSALKVMHPSMGQDADAISRFNREAANASRISHPNVAAIYDFGETGEGMIYLAMEFVEGEALTALVERSGALPPARAADIVLQTGDALQAAHDMGIVHRDLKPDNIMITRARDGSDCVKVVDFGIAKSNEGSQKVTKTGLVVGTPEYMSPEQLAGDKLDGRSDIYSLGLVAFRLLTRQLPFPSDSAQESMIMRLTDRPKRLGDMRADVAWPAELQAVMDRALERDAKLRYDSAARFGRDFDAAVKAMPEAVAAAAGTIVIGAMPAGGAIPPTRVNDAAAGATVQMQAPMVAPPVTARMAKGRTPMLAAAGVLVALGVGAIAMNAFTGDAATSATAPVDSNAVATPAPPQKTDATAPGVPEVTRAGAAQLKREIAETPPGAVRPAVGSVAPRGGPSSGTQVPIPEQLAAIDPLSLSAPRDAIAQLNRLAGMLMRGTEDHRYAQLIRAEAHAALEQGEQMCTVLGTIAGEFDDATRANRLAQLRRAC